MTGIIIAVWAAAIVVWLCIASVGGGEPIAPEGEEDATDRLR